MASERWSILRMFVWPIVLLPPLLLLSACGSFDPYRVAENFPNTPARPFELEEVAPVAESHALHESRTGCIGEVAPLENMTVFQVVRRALCTNPKTKGSWAAAAGASAELGKRYGELMPEIKSTTVMTAGNLQFHATANPFLDQNNPLLTSFSALDLEWVIFDGGLRVANIEAARETLFSQEAGHNSVLLQVFSEVVRQYFNVLSAEAALAARREAEKAADASFRVSNGRHKAGVAPPSDVLQAQSALGQAALDRARAEGGLLTERGRLAILIGLPADALFTLKAVALPEVTSNEIEQVDVLMRFAQEHHPAIVGAAARLRAREADVRASEAYGLPTLSLTAGLRASDDVGQATIPERAIQFQNTVGFRLVIPLSVTDRAYGIRAAKAGRIQAQAEFESAMDQVSLDVWSSYQRFRADLNSIRIVSDLVATSERSFALAKGRYQNGIGSILELLNTEASLANARQQKVEIVAACAADRLMLAAAIGKLGLSPE